MSSLSDRFSFSGRPQEALTAIEESVHLWRGLATRRQLAFWKRLPTFNPDLASSLATLSNRLSDLGRIEEALGAINEALALYRSLATRKPTALNLELVMSLFNMYVFLSGMGRHEEARRVYSEAENLCFALAFDPRAAHNSALVDFLRRFSELGEFGEEDQAWTRTQEIADLWQAFESLGGMSTSVSHPISAQLTIFI